MSNSVIISVLGVHGHAWFAILALGCTLLVLDSVAGLCCNEARAHREAAGRHDLYSVHDRTDKIRRYGRKARCSRPMSRENERRLPTLEKTSQRISASRRALCVS